MKFVEAREILSSSTADHVFLRCINLAGTSVSICNAFVYTEILIITPDGCSVTFVNTEIIIITSDC